MWGAFLASSLDKYSAVVKLTTTDGKTYDTTVYNRKGVMEICRFCGFLSRFILASLVVQPLFRASEM